MPARIHINITQFPFLKHLPPRKVIFSITAIFLAILITTFIILSNGSNNSSPKADYTFHSTFPTTGFALLNENKASGFKVLLSQNNKSTIPSGRFEVQNDWVDFSLSPTATNQKKTTFKKEKENGKDVIVWQDAIPSVDISYRMNDDGLKEDIIIKDKTPALSALKNHEPLKISFRLIPHGIIPRLDLSGRLSSFRNNKTGEYRFHMEKPLLVDAKGTKYEVLDYELTSTDTKKSPSYDLSLMLPREWFTNPARVYPVILNTYIVHNEATGNFNGL